MPNQKLATALATQAGGRFDPECGKVLGGYFCQQSTPLVTRFPHSLGDNRVGIAVGGQLLQHADVSVFEVLMVEGDSFAPFLTQGFVGTGVHVPG